MKKLASLMVGVALVSLIAVMAIGETKYNSGATAAGAALTFKAVDREQFVSYINAKLGGDGKTVDVYGRTGSPQYPSAFETTNVQCENASIVITNGDRIVYQHTTGKAEYGTCASASATNIYLSFTPSPAYASGDRIYEITQIGSFNAGGTNSYGDYAVLSIAGDNLVTIPADSPAVFTAVGDTNNTLTVTVKD